MSPKLLPLLVVASACGAPQTEISIAFTPLVMGEPFSCTKTYAGLGSKQTTVQPLDFRLYVHNVRFVRRNGQEVALQLKQDGVYQRDDVALLDFEDDTGSCVGGSPETHSTITGSFIDTQDITALRYDVGLPKARNHLDAATAPAPYNAPGMWWSWQGGYKFIRLDWKTTQMPAWYMHLGATGCNGAPAQGYTCNADNVMSVELANFTPSKDKVLINVTKLYEGVDLETQPDLKTDFVAGCMSSPSDRDCPGLFANLGISLKGETPKPQTLFEVER